MTTTTSTPVRMSTCGQLQHAREAALPADPDGGPWETGLATALGIAVRMLANAAPAPVNPYDVERMRLLRLLLDDYQGARRRYESERA